MNRTIIVFVISSLLKGMLLFFIILIGDHVENIPILLRFLVYFVMIGLLDWQMLKLIKNEMTTLLLIKTIVFSYLSFIATLWITGPLFQLYNYLTETVADGAAQMPISAIILYLILGILTTLIVTITWTKKNKITAIN